MATIHQPKSIFSRFSERLLLAGVSVLLLLLLGRLYANLSPQLNEVEEAYIASRAINLSPSIDKTRLNSVIFQENYLEDTKDIRFLVNNLAQSLQAAGGSLDNLGALNKKAFTIPAIAASDYGGSGYHNDFLVSLYRLGFDSTLYAIEKIRPKPHNSVVNLGKSDGLQMSGVVTDFQTKKPLEGVLVRLVQHFPSAVRTEQFFRYARTNLQGHYAFEGLTPSQSYSVLPLMPGFEFGTSQGSDNLKENSENLHFRAKPHKIRLLNADVYQRIKENKAFTVRTPQEFRSQFAFWTLLFFISFWLVHLGWVVRRFKGDFLILPLLMLLSGISFVMMLSIQDPLLDTFRADDVVQGVMMGLAALFLFSQVNVARFYVSKYFDYVATRLGKSTFQQTGWTWLLLAFGLMLLVVLFGTGPEGSGVKVNLSLWGFSFQPSEITKFLVVVFFAGYFTTNTEFLRQIPSIQWRFKNNLHIFIGFLLLLSIYLLLGDMGPALVLCLTFLIFYAVARNELGIMLLGVSLYSALIWGLSRVVDSHEKMPFVAATVLYLLAWWAYGFFKKDFKETPLFTVLLIAVFIFGEALPFNFAQRLADRNDMFRNNWDNQLHGGDQVAHGIWSLASGGWFGQGLGNGFPNVMPASHTDMILPSIGEELGLFGLIAIFLCVGILLHRTLLIARRAGQPFTFYLCAGIAVVTGVQFMLIASGSLGSLPLTGVSVPFLSYGRVAMAINLAAFGLVLSSSNQAGEPIQQKYIQHHYDNIIVTGSVAFSIGLLKLVGLLAFYQVIKSTEYIVKPALVINRMGERIYSYNPRIHLLTQKLEAGTIYDRNGQVLATSNRTFIKEKKEQLLEAGAKIKHLKTIYITRQKRYYPFGNQLLFWLGDYNKHLLWGETNGYAAEYRHLAALRGFETTPPDQSNEVIALSKTFREERFLPPTPREFILTKYDYSALTPLLKSGMNSRLIEKFKAQNRDIKLSVDVALQIRMQQVIGNHKDFKTKRVSVVILNAQSGEVLTSAVNPLPNPETLRHISEIPKEQFQRIFSERFKGQLITDKDLGMTYATPPGSTAKILTAFAALNRLGTTGANTEYEITDDEIIRKNGIESEPTGLVNMQRAIVNSSNIYFIRLANEHKLDTEMQALYDAVGMRLAQKGGYYFSNTTSPTQLSINHAVWQREVFAMNRAFYVQPGRQGKRIRYNSEFSGIAWGQGQLEATPLALARMAGTIANGGELQPSRFLLEQAGKPIQQPKSIQLAQQQGISRLLKGFMLDHSRGLVSGLAVAGKTGTPQRILNHRFVNDGWYVFFANSPKLNAPMVVCIRIEDSGSSAKAVALANQVIIPELMSLGYF